MFAKDEKTQRTLRDNWHDIVTDRRYVAVVEGSMEKDYDTVVSWLTDKTLYVSSSEYDDGGSKSITHYKTIKRANGYSLLELDLETGRKNQIRVHMQDLGHPIIGDGRYGREDAPNLSDDWHSMLSNFVSIIGNGRFDGVRDTLSGGV